MWWPWWVVGQGGGVGWGGLVWASAVPGSAWNVPHDAVGSVLASEPPRSKSAFGPDSDFFARINHSFRLVCNIHAMFAGWLFLLPPWPI
ncbi:hypothetical protein KC19_1G328600 [Ceratodon purpureus]|uniref:Uncharacterized protein n=1 Tax=Ceratodon purpureus TaxID=3225 RepID=A0A8T0JEU6_CERPU|nr:hypothetical protein KC19_1G328600 [Ceratodon purpureus]